jgi:hypothetical protein
LLKGEAHIRRFWVLGWLRRLYFFYFYRKGLIGVWYCNLRNPVKATLLGHPRHIETRPHYKAFNIYKSEDWKVQVPSRKNKTLGSRLLANSRQSL